MIGMEKELFDDLIASCKEAIEYKKGNIELKTTVVEIPDEEIEMDQMIYLKVNKLSKENKQKIMQYAEELLNVSNG